MIVPQPEFSGRGKLANSNVADDLIGQLSKIVGANHLLTGRDAAPYGKDWMGKYIAQPLAVVRPGSTKQVSQILALPMTQRRRWFRWPVIPGWWAALMHRTR